MLQLQEVNPVDILRVNFQSIQKNYEKVQALHGLQKEDNHIHP